MEGMTDSLFRQAHHDMFGAVSAYYIPFIRLTGDLKLTNGETREISPEENAAFPCVPQVLTKDADQLLWAGRMLGDLGYGLMDLNLGCPAPTVVTRGRGSALLKDPDALKRLFDRYFASCPLPLSVKTRMTSSKREQLLSTASTGKNESAKGLMGRLRDFFDRGADEDIAGFTSPLFLASASEHSTTPTLDWEWSMMEYENALSSRVERNDADARAAWDELEKSVVARVADDVKVSIKGRSVELTIIKKMA